MGRIRKNFPVQDWTSCVVCVCVWSTGFCRYDNIHFTCAFGFNKNNIKFVTLYWKYITKAQWMRCKFAIRKFQIGQKYIIKRLIGTNKSLFEPREYNKTSQIPWNGNYASGNCSVAMPQHVPLSLPIPIPLSNICWTPF